jgi:hypothetical protein
MGREKKVVLKEGSGKIITMDSIAEISPDERGEVVVAGSHGSGSAARHVVRYMPFGIILNDAGKGKNDAGISGLPVLETMGILGATVDCMSARIGEGQDSYQSGIISAANDKAREAGICVGMKVVEAAKLMLEARDAQEKIQAAFIIHEDEAGRIVVTDTISYLNETHRESVAVGGSHCARTTYDFVKDLNLKGVFLNDAGKGKDGAGISGLPVYQTAAIPAGAVDCMTARIGYGLDAWENGLISSANELAQGLGVTAGMSVREAAFKVLKAVR